MNTENGPLLPSGGYRRLRSYKVAEAVYDATVVFCRHFLSDDRRMTDQMVQAARSGVRNISEGSGAAATSRKMEMKLTNVARASLGDELLRDYESFLRQRGLPVWPKDSAEAMAMRRRLADDQVDELPTAERGDIQLTGLAGLQDFVARASPEAAGNAMVCAVNQATYLLGRQLRKQEERFLADGGFTEALHGSRVLSRPARPFQTAQESGLPNCPVCGKPMVRRTARTGPRSGSTFWGCPSYPECQGTRNR